MHMTILGLTKGVTACAATVALESARTAVQAAEADANVQKYAALDLEFAKKELEIAQSAATRQDDAAVAQSACLAGQRDLATEQAARLQAEVDQLKATPTPRGLVLTLGDVLFDTGKAELNPGSSQARPIGAISHRTCRAARANRRIY